MNRILAILILSIIVIMGSATFYVYMSGDIFTIAHALAAYTSNHTSTTLIMIFSLGSIGLLLGFAISNNHENS